jgi:hypothetical protein
MLNEKGGVMRCSIVLLFAGFACAFSVPVWSDSEIISTENANSAVLSEENTLLDECNGSQADMNDCLKKLVIDSSKNLIVAENEILSKINNMDEPRKYIRISKMNFVQPKDGFVIFRKKHCDFHESLVGGAAGAAHENAQLRCQFRLNYWRAKQLRNIISDTE